jgi:hypothetical protein
VTGRPLIGSGDSIERTIAIAVPIEPTNKLASVGGPSAIATSSESNSSTLTMYEPAKCRVARYRLLSHPAAALTAFQW